MPASARVEWSPGPSHIADEIDTWWSNVERELDARLGQVGAEMRAYAQINHPWVNRTGEAEAGLSYDVEKSGETYVLTIYHTAPHGLWLEVRWGGRWGIIPDTLAANLGRVMEAVRAAMG